MEAFTTVTHLSIFLKVEIKLLNYVKQCSENGFD